jgi:hypothetical protein
MPKNINSAFRIYQIMEKARLSDGGKSVHNMWLDVFEIKEGGMKASHGVSENLSLVNLEMENVIKMMSEANFSSDIYRPYFDKLLNVINPQNLSQQWNQLRTHNLTEATMIVVRYCSEILPNEEDLLSEAEIQELELSVDQLLEKIKNGSLPNSLKAIVEKNLKNIKRHLNKYGICGSQVLKDVASEIIPVILENSQVIKENEASEEIGMWEKICKGTSQLYKKAKKGEEVLSTIQKIYSEGKPIIDIAFRFLSEK